MRAGGRGAPDTPRSLRPAEGSSPAGLPGAPALQAPQLASARSPGAEGRQQHLQLRYRNHRSGAAAAGTCTWGRAPALPSREGKLGNSQVSAEAVFPELPRPSAARSARPPRGRHSRRSPAQPRGALGGKASPRVTSGRTGRAVLLSPHTRENAAPLAFGKERV